MDILPDNTIINQLKQYINNYIKLDANGFFRSSYEQLLFINTNTIIHIIENNTDINDKCNCFGETALHIVSKYNYTESVKIAQLFINKGADVNIVTKDGYTPLHFASNYGYTEIAQLLINNGADVNIVTEDEKHETPLHYASHKGNTEIVKMLIDADANVDAMNNDNETPLHTASSNGYKDIVNMLIDAGANVDVKQHNGNTPLHYASSEGCCDIVKILINAGANVNAVTKYDYTPLIHALLYAIENYTKIVKIVKILIDAGANVDAMCNDNGTPLHIASYIESSDCCRQVVKLLIKAGANVNVKCNGVTPLYNALEYKNITNVKLLIKAGANVNIVDANGKTLLDNTINKFDSKYERYYNYIKTIKLLLNAIMF